MTSAAGAPCIGVLALQGGFAAHEAVLRRLGAEVREVRTPAHLDELDGLVLPGGESTTLTLGIEREELAGPLRELAGRGTPVLGTCAGLILLDREHLGVMDIVARRNAFGRQVRSFETDLELPVLGRDADQLGRGSDQLGRGALRAVFIRAPWVEEHGPGVEVLAELDGHPVAVRQGNVLAVAFHPELTRDTRLHRWLLEAAAAPAVTEAA